MLGVGEFRGHWEDKMLDTTPRFHSKKYFIDMSIYYTFVVTFLVLKERGKQIGE